VEVGVAQRRLFLIDDPDDQPGRTWSVCRGWHLIRDAVPMVLPALIRELAVEAVG
jgi:hypothetical protein